MTMPNSSNFFYTGFDLLLQSGRYNWLLVSFVVGCMMLLCGCGKARPSVTPSSSSFARFPIFDEAAADPKYSNIIVKVDRDLPADTWDTIPHVNISRGQRVAPIARDILLEITPRLKRMTVPDLIHSLKVEDGSGFLTNYIGDALYPQGNNMIISEIRSRPAPERQVLLSWPYDGSQLDTGSQGESWTVDELVRELRPVSP